MEKTEPCPSCRTQTPIKKTWLLRRGKGSQKKTYRIFLFECSKCGRKFRKAKPEEDSIYSERDTKELKKPSSDKEKKLPRILVEWICGKCKKVHRISFSYSFRSVLRKRQGFKVFWGNARQIRKVELGHETSLSELNEFLNSLFSEEFNAKEYVKIYYPKKLFVLLTKNEGETNPLPSKLIYSYTVTINHRIKMFYSYHLKRT